jgi:hypothetical protein
VHPVCKRADIASVESDLVFIVGHNGQTGGNCNTDTTGERQDMLYVTFYGNRISKSH